MSKTATFVIIFTALAACQSAVPADKTTCIPLQDWSEVSTVVRSSLESTVGFVAAKGEKFNATDVVGGGLAANRFLSACQDKDFTAVALERGGRGFRIEVFHYTSGKLMQRWTQSLGKDQTVAVDLMRPPHER